MSNQKQAKLVGGVSRHVSGRTESLLRFSLSIDRGLASGKVDVVELDEAQILELVASGARALGMIYKARSS